VQLTAALRLLTANGRSAGIGWSQEELLLMQTSRRLETVIFVSIRDPEPALLTDLEAYGLVMHWAHSIAAALDLLKSMPNETVIVTELALTDGNWRDLVERVRCHGILTPIVLMTPASTAELWWDALECCVDEILPAPLQPSRLRQFLDTHFSP